MANDIKISADYSDIDRATKSVGRLGQSMGKTSLQQTRFSKGSKKFTMGTQQAGFQVGDFAAQVQNGTSALVALGQQGPQLLGMFGAIGAVAGAFLAITTAIIKAKNAGKEMSFDFKGLGRDLAKTFEPAMPIIEAIGSAFKWLGSTAMSVLNVLIRGFAGYLVAIQHFPAVVKEVFDKFKVTLTLAATNVRLLGNQLALMLNKFAKDSDVTMTDFSNVVGGTIRGSVAYIKTIWGTLDESLANVMKTAAKNTIKVIEDMLNSVVSKINSLSQAINSVLPERFKEYGIGEVGSFDFGTDALFNITETKFKDIGNRANQAFWNEYYKDTQFSDPSRFDTLIQGQEYAIAMLQKQAAQYASTLAEPNQAFHDMLETIASIESIDLGSYCSWVAKKAKETGKETEHALQGMIDNIQRSFEDGFMSIFDHTKTAKEKFRDMAYSIIKELYKVLVVQQMVGSFDMNKGTGSGIMGAIMGGNKANGGPVEAGRTYLVGERGPETFTAPSNGKIYPTESLGGGVTVVQNFSFSANGDESVKRIIAQEAPKIADMTTASIMDQRRRGGSMRKTFG